MSGKLLKSKEAATIIVWYGVVMFTSMILQSLSWTDTDEIKRWVTSITVSFTTAEYSFPEWFSAILAVGSTVIIYIGPSAFQVTALQFGTDQLQDSPNET